MLSEQSRERRVRRALARRGLRLVKTPARSWLRGHYGAGYMVMENNHVKLGCWSREYQANLKEVEAFAGL